MRSHRITLALLVMFSLLIESASFAISCVSGGSCGGGGTVIRCEGQKRFFLLDLLNIQPERATMTDPTRVAAPAPRPPGSSSFDVRDGSNVTNAAVALALKQLRSWRVATCEQQAFTSLLAAAIAKQIEQMPFWATTANFNEIKEYDLPESGARCELRTAILFLPHYGAILSLPVWNELDRPTQAGLLIHEALRQLQSTSARLDNRILQEVTARFVADRPHLRPDFETILGNSELAASLRLSVEQTPRCQEPVACHPEQSEAEILRNAQPQTLQGMKEELSCLQAHHQWERQKSMRANAGQRHALREELLARGILAE